MLPNIEPLCSKNHLLQKETCKGHQITGTTSSAAPRCLVIMLLKEPTVMWLGSNMVASLATLF